MMEPASRRCPISSQSESENRTQVLLEDLMTSELFAGGERLRNLPLFMRQKDLAHVLFLADIYKQIVDVPGYIAEFGVMWGRNLNLFHCLRECLEPYNLTRRLLGFDTFSGFVESIPEDHRPDVTARPHQKGDYAVEPGYEKTLEQVLLAQESISHLSHLRRFDLMKGPVEQTLPRFLEMNPQAVMALCYLDLDLYKPTRTVLEAIRPRLLRGSVLVFDEMLNPDYPGETQAVSDCFGLPIVSLRRSSLSGWKTYCVVGD
jgi:hypothetical protein